MSEHQGNYLLWDGTMRIQLSAEPHLQIISLPWNTGQRFDEVPGIRAVVSTKELPDHMAIGSINYVSDRLKGLLEQSNVAAQFFPVIDLQTTGGTRLDERRFYAMNLLLRIACFDFKLSNYDVSSTALGGGVRRIRRLRILEDRICNAPVAVVSELTDIVMRRDVMERLRVEKIRGCRWREIDDVRFPQTEWPAES